MIKALRFALPLVVAIALAVQATAVGSGGRDLVEFDVMTTVVEPFTGSAQPIRGVSGGGLPWEIDSARGRVRSDGRVDVTVEGLVLARRAPVPEGMQGTNPSAQMRAVVSCLTPASPEEGVSVATDPVPATPDGNVSIDAELDLPEPCIAPIVFVTSPAGAWFAATGR
jgi:hypothetical protein